ncbi:response regulator [Alginatibacterium sediminis]|uniref:Response regulator n=1 Tax=Alginatibacterium sediminis TaxID=2164068 RepID=A0A420EB06_9ALTE|nr:response regulator [Alginatibacterium sediminis]RKF17834.1 response regulator [Alginatibacterium sediminis]
MDALTLADLTILLVEPSRTQRNIIRARMHEAGVDNFLMAENAQQAFEAAETSSPDLVVSAMYFEDGTATELVQRMRASTMISDTPFMLISSEACHHTLDAIKQAGVIAILPKPFVYTDLLNALHATVNYIDPDNIETDLSTLSLSTLIVDDSATARRHISRVIENLGIKDISFAENGQEALDILERQSFDLIVTDYNMPVMDGAAFIEALRLKEQWKDIPVLMVTSERDGAKLDGVRQSGVSALVDKPFDMEAVRSILGHVFD